MKRNLIKTDNYLLVVDDKDKDFVVRSYGLYKNYKVGIVTLCNEDILEFEGECIDESNLSKIISHLPLNGATVLEGVPVLPPIENDDDKDLFFYKQVMNSYSSDSQSYTAYEKGFIKGYNKAREKYKFTEEDLRKAIDMAREQKLVKYTDGDYEFEHGEDEIIQSIQRHSKLPIAFWCEMRTKQMPEFHEDLPKTIINSQGRTEWVGKYVWE